MSEVINLRTRRKQAARDTARAEAAIRAARHGESLATRNLHDARSAKAARDLEAHRREDKDGSEPGA